MLKGISPQHISGISHLATVDIVIIDEVSMLTAELLGGVHQALNHVVSCATGQAGMMAFGRKSILAVGDLYQLPAVERMQFMDQVYESELWGEFKFLELTQIMRLDPSEVRFAELLSRARRGWQHMTADDWQLLERRVCANHTAEPELFVDNMTIRPPGGRRADERREEQRVVHCPCHMPALANGTPDFARAPCVLTARRAKVEELNRCHTAGTSGAVVAEAIDRGPTGRAVTDAAVRDAISDRLSGLPPRLALHVGQLVVITVNRRRTHAGFVNGQLAVVIELAPVHAPTEVVGHVSPGYAF